MSHLMMKVHSFHTLLVLPSLILSLHPKTCIVRVTNLMFTVKNIEDEPQNHVAFLSSMCDDCYDSVDQQNDREYSAFLRSESCDSLYDTYIEYEALDFNVILNMDDVFIDVSGMDHL